MPTMVMSNPPKPSGKAVRAKRTKKTDNIVPIHYMYVGTPKKKFTLYVRERLVYRSSVEVTYEDVFNYLVNIYNDESLSLHYAVNNTYVPITTTGQLHTFISHVHNDPNALLYVENADYVWNVTPQSKGHKMAKRNPGSDAADPVEGSEEELEDEEDCETVDEENSQEEDEEEEEYDEEEEEEEVGEDPLAVISDAINRCIVSGGETSGGEAMHPEESNISPKLLSSLEAVSRLKSILDNAIAGGKMCDAPTMIAEHLVDDAIDSTNPANQKVYKETVDMLKSCIGTGLLHYYKEIIGKFFQAASQQFQEEGSGPDGLSISVDSLGPLVQYFQPAHDAEKLLEFVESSMTAASNMLQCVQHLAQLDKEFEYFDRLTEQCVKSTERKRSEHSQLPSHDEICERLTSAITSAHFGFQVLQPVFPADCSCKPAIAHLILELEKVLAVMKGVVHKTCAPAHVMETKLTILATLSGIMSNYKGLKCKLHESIEAALRDAEAYKWRSDSTLGYEQWEELTRRGEALLEVPVRIRSTLLDAPAELRPLFRDEPPKEPNSEMLLVAEQPPMTMVVEEAAVKGTASQIASVSEEPEHQTPPTNPGAAVSGSTVGGAPATVQKEMSPELKKLIEEMYKKTPPAHNYVYPNPPKPGTILIPTGGFARCRCSKNCTETLMEPAYEYMERFNEPRQTVWEKTKQKRFKKN